MRRRRRDSLSKLNCIHIDYGLAVSLEKFDLAGFSKEIDRIPGHSDRWIKGSTSLVGVAPTRAPSWADYHVHFNCHWTKREFHASLEYFRGAEKPKSGDKGPFAEDMIPWLGQFFKNEKATARVTAAYVYAGKRWTASLPLPMRL